MVRHLLISNPAPQQLGGPLPRIRMWSTTGAGSHCRSSTETCCAENHGLSLDLSAPCAKVSGTAALRISRRAVTPNCVKRSRRQAAAFCQPIAPCGQPCKRTSSTSCANSNLKSCTPRSVRLSGTTRQALRHRRERISSTDPGDILISECVYPLQRKGVEHAHTSPYTADPSSWWLMSRRDDMSRRT